jgi:hypothetical protein
VKNEFYDLLCEYKISNGNFRVTKFDKELYCNSSKKSQIAKLEERILTDTAPNRKTSW